MAGRIFVLFCAFFYLVESKSLTDNAKPKADIMVNPSQGHYEIDYKPKYTYNPSGSIYVTTPQDWTLWMNADTPTVGDGDHEIYASQGSPCGKKLPIEVQCRDRGTLRAWYQTGDILSRRCVLAGPTSGIICLNSQQARGRCRDYEVRYKCAYVPGPLPWTENPSSPVYWGDQITGAKIEPDNVEAIDTIPASAQATKGL